MHCKLGRTGILYLRRSIKRRRCAIRYPKNAPSLVLLDIRMPKLMGVDIIKIAREQGFQGKFIILSGYSDFSYAQAAIRYGVDFYLTKPIDEDELLEAIRTIYAALQSERQNKNHIALYREKAKDVILHDLIVGTLQIGDEYGLSTAALQNMELEAAITKVVIYENLACFRGQQLHVCRSLISPITVITH